MAAAWERVREELRGSFPDSTFGLWFNPLEVVAERGSILYLTGPKRVLRWVERRYTETLERMLRANGAEGIRIRFIDERESIPGAGAGMAASAGAPAAGISSEYSFERFVVGPENRLAHAAALAVAEAPAQAYNPLFLHGPPGLGKTHLLGAIGNYLQRHAPELIVHSTTAEAFTAEFIAAVQGTGIAAFKQRYRTCDVLLLDDVQFLGGKARTADEFFHTFNDLHQNGAQLVLSADKLPAELSDLADRLRDRFEWGLVASLGRPDRLTRAVFVHKQAAQETATPIAPAALEALADRAVDNIRLLRGALTRVIAHASLTGTQVTEALIEQLFPVGREPTVELEANAEVTPEQVQRLVCERLGVAPNELLSKSRLVPLSRARQLAMYLTREHTSLSLPQIATAFQRSDHTTVMHAITQVSKRRDTDATTRELIASLSAALADPTPAIAALRS